ncbi:MAG: hypothetical protein EA363_06670 [Balneolaceae bacterium]|nr:MAG: hypothetical protein EA363_06670 [Balneolaceae bacterium]
MKSHRASLLMSMVFLMAAISIYPPLVHAQQRQEQARPFPMLSGGTDNQHFVDELGLRLSMGWLYQSPIDTATYRLDSGDLLGISLEGNVSATLRGLRVNSQGSVMIPEVGIIQVSGLLLQEAEERIREKVLLAYPDTRATLALEQPRTIQLHVVGNIPFAGPQLVFAQTRLDQAIYRSFFKVKMPVQGTERMEDDGKDPQEVRSIERAIAPLGMLENRYPEEFVSANRFALRNITINRADGSTMQADLIRYLKTGDLASNPVVKEGDIISINHFYQYNPRVSISGAVHKSLELEFRGDDSIPVLIEMAGGLTYDATQESARVMRITDQGLSEVILASDEEIRDYVLHPNDRVIIPYDREKRASHSVQVFGEARYTGRFPIEQGVTSLYDLVSMVGGTTDRALPQAAYLSRSRPGKTEYGLHDDLFGPKNLPFIPIPNSGFGIRPSFDPVVLTRTSNQFLEGFEYLQLEADLIRDRVHIDLRDTEQMKQIRLFDGDRLQIPKDDGTVFVFGQVNNPGYYTFINDQSTSQYIGNAGGFALAAEPDRVFIIKPGSYSWYRVGETDIEPGDLIFVDRLPFEDVTTAREYELRMRELRNSRVQLVLAGVATVASVITAYVAVTR